jgi:hypothetical protein
LHKILSSRTELFAPETQIRLTVLDDENANRGIINNRMSDELENTEANIQDWRFQDDSSLEERNQHQIYKRNEILVMQNRSPNVKSEPESHRSNVSSSHQRIL